MTRAPLFRFLALGLVLFFADRLLFPVVSPASHPLLTVSREQISRLAEQARRSTGRAATPTELDAQIEAWIDDELLVRAARARNWHRSDPVVQRRLIKNMRFLEDAGDPVSDASLLARAHALEMDQTDEVVRRRLVQRMRLSLAATASRDGPTNVELARRFDADPEKFRRPDRVRLTQIYLSRDRHGNALEDRAMALLEELIRESIPAGAARERGDPFLLPAELPAASPRSLEARFGPEFATQVMTLPLQRWSGPVRSAYGLHLLWIHERERGAVPSWREVERELRSGWRAASEARALRRALGILREATEIRIEAGASAPDPIPSA
ncbi:MAG: peptidyl-prolyl cis-trans isomerase [Myxococcales bacterium]|nr:peptidyl-prolyl cis-trans isomerase [Myxococcales bacterium]